MFELSQKQARKLVLNSQRIHRPVDFGRGVNGVAAALEHLSYVQIDTISVVERAHHHTLWNRVNGYRSAHLEQAVADKRVFEYWSHAAAYLPMQDYRFTLPNKHRLAQGGEHWYKKDPKQAAYVLDKIRAEGPLQASDFNQGRSIKGSGWGDQKPAKRALERLFMEGELMVAYRQGFQKVFDLTERVVPNDIDTRLPSETDFLDYLIFSAIRAHGLVNAAEIAYLRKGYKIKVQQRLKQLCEDGTLTLLRQNGIEYVADSSFEKVLNLRSSQTKTLILSPFDNLVIQRQRMRNLFDFDYQIECYVPEAKRKFGYFVLPILMGQTFVGRLDAKVDRRTKQLNIKSCYFDLANTQRFSSTAFQTSLKKALISFLNFNQGEELVFERMSLNGQQISFDW